ENPSGYTYSDPSNPALQKLLPTYNVDVQFGPPRVPGDLKAFQELTAPSADPYGWSILLRLGLSMGLTLRDEGTNDLVTGEALLQALQAALTALRTDTQTNPKFADWLSYLHVELLFQPGQSFSPEEKAASARDLLAMVQLSLRPRVEPYLTYGVVEIKGPARSQVELQFTLNSTCTLIDQSSGAGRQQELPPPGQPLSDPVVQTVTLPLTGQTRLLLRYASGKAPTMTQVRFPLPRKIDLPPALTQAEFSPSPDGGNYLTISPEALSAFRQALALTPGQRQTLRQELVNALSPGSPLSAQDAIQIDALFDLNVEALTPFSPRDERSTYFKVPSGLTDDLADRSSELGVQWRQIKLYLESINSTDPTQPAIVVPTDAASIEKMLPDFLTWSQRFFDASADDPAKGGGTGPWLVTAYPRISTPAYVSPDDSGRLKYDHLITDRWAHNYRYYIRPSSRYDLLWQSLLESPDLFPTADLQPRRELDSFVLSARSLVDLEGKLPPQLLDALYPLENQRFLGESRFLAAAAAVARRSLTVGEKTVLLAAVETFTEVLPDPDAGGLDVTLDRSQPIEKPLVLSSSRLDALGTPSNPAAPGRTWEVMVAQHLEQRLVERNQTLVRRLAYRQIAFTLLRSFAYPDWPKQLEQASTPNQAQEFKLELDVVAASYPEVPSTYPEQPDHLNPANLSAADARSLDLPLRNGNFQQGALVLQWDALPFFYEHRLLLIAQSATTVSEPNELVQRDFEYRTPEPTGEIAVLNTTFGANNLTIRTRQVELPLQRLWDALSPAVQAQWDSDNPDLGVSAGPGPTGNAILRKPASLPDPEVIYQLVELYSGNLEVQVEYFFDPATEGYVRRQLGQRLLGELKRLRPPTVANPQANFALETYLHRVQEIKLERSGYFDPPLIGLGETEGKVWRRQQPSLFLVGVFTRRDRTNLLINSVALLQARRVPGTASALTSSEKLLEQESFMDDWYSTRRFANAP
ncbi:MAG TPA: hypothetical protein VLS96_22450, partial [Nodosilinea sp.]|nr:hypothetical protein [Nodosilinea sp.]